MAAALFAYPALLMISHQSSLALGLALIVSLATLPIAYARRKELALFNTADRGPVLGLLVFLQIAVVSGLAWQAPFWWITNYERLLGAFIMIAGIRLLKPPETAFYMGCAIGALGAGVFALWQCLWLGEPRAFGASPPFGMPLASIFGGLSAVLAFLPIFADPPGLTRPGRLLLTAGLIGGVTAAVLSGSRYVWVTCTLLLLWRVGRAKPFAALLLLIFIVGASLMVPMLAGRWDAAMSDLLLYSHGNSETALGYRFEIWQAAWAAFTSHPLFGIGPTGFNAWLIARTEAGLGPASLANFDHAHNDLLHAAATGGLVQVFALAIAFWLPWRFFYRINASRSSPSARAGLMLIVAFLIFGLTDAFITFRIALTVYVVGIALLVGWAGVEAEAVRTRPAGAKS